MLRAVFVAVAAAAVVARYLRERRRVAIVERLSGAAGREYLERTRTRSDRFDLVVTVVLAAGAAVAAVTTALAR